MNIYRNKILQLEVAHDTDLVHSIMTKRQYKKIYRLVTLVAAICSELESMEKEFNEYFDSRKEPWQQSEDGQRFVEEVLKVSDFRKALINAAWNMDEFLPV